MIVPDDIPCLGARMTYDLVFKLILDCITVLYVFLMSLAYGNMLNLMVKDTRVLYEQIKNT